METSLHRPILQVNGEEENLEKDSVSYSFKSEYGEGDILYSLEEMFPVDVVTSTNLE